MKTHSDGWKFTPHHKTSYLWIVPEAQLKTLGHTGPSEERVFVIHFLFFTTCATGYIKDLFSTAIVF